MHTTTVTINGTDWICHHNGDYSGEVVIYLDRTDFPAEHRIPFELMKQLVADWVRQREIARLEQATANEVLTGKAGGS